MQLIDKAILAEACGLSLGVLLGAMAIGLALWLLGWWSHRFWVVLVATLGAGIYGLMNGEAYKTHPLACGVLFGLAGGMLALAVVRLVAFVAGGFMGLAVAQLLIPTLEQQIVPFLLCGLVSLLLFRPSVMLLTSLAGSLLLSHAGLAMMNRQGTVNAVAWTDQGTMLGNWVIVGLTVLGFAIQYVHDRRTGAKKDRKEKKRKRRDDD
ncbi:MAG: hypothetical protein K2X38_19320 [Gemmataceae bacterium]|nr:hypothetical protein [Gemmataceae bacterium]